jgi:hypothetical protein
VPGYVDTPVRHEMMRSDGACVEATDMRFSLFRLRWLVRVANDSVRLSFPLRFVKMDALSQSSCRRFDQPQSCRNTLILPE